MYCVDDGKGEFAFGEVFGVAFESLELRGKEVEMVI